MDLFEYQARDIFEKHGVPVLGGVVATTPDEARAGAEQLLGDAGGVVVVKAQVKVGGRGKAGGVKLARSADEAREIPGRGARAYLDIEAVIAAAKAAQAQRTGAAFGIAPVEPTVDFGRVMDHVAGVIGAIAPNDSVERFERLGVRVLKEEARFIGRTELQAGPHRLRSRRIVLATGSRPTAPRGWRCW